ncbi:hypothetical protein Trydic_g20128, partial [Trypoxylus dichotomus]
PFLSVLTG